MARERTSNGTVPVSIFSFNFLCKDESKVKTALKNNKHHSCVLLDYSTNCLRFRNYDIQEPQCFEVAKRGWNKAAECILLKFQFLKAVRLPNDGGIDPVRLFWYNLLKNISALTI